jgi:putative peptidoglycan lipid II flippase
LTPLYPVILTIIGLFFFMPVFGPYTLSIGFTAGYLFELITMLIVFKLEKFPLDFIFRFTNSIKLLLRQAFHKASSSLFAAIVPIVNQFFAVRQVVGSVSLITYAQKVPLFINMVLTMSIGITILPYFSKKVTSSALYKVKDYYKIIIILFVASALACIPLLFLSDFIVKALFFRGKINIHDIYVISLLQKVYFSQIPFYLIAIIAVRLLTALNKNKHTLYGSIATLILIFSLNYVFEKPYGIYGIALATVGATVLNMAINLWYSFVDLRAYANE